VGTGVVHVEIQARGMTEICRVELDAQHAMALAQFLKRVYVLLVLERLVDLKERNSNE
jgi:hypothetical protein